MQSFTVEKSLIDSYKELFGEISFGLLAGVEKTDSTDDSVNGQFNGILYDNATGKFKNKVAHIDFTKLGYDTLEMKLTGLDSYPNIQIYCCAYLIVDGKILYLHNQQSSETAIYFSIA
jgi:hypothetical protein